ncbi:mitochondrial fission ELM1 family protein [Maricaulis sp.]|uniref:mitochondrial fission ELM1 family protein n=1 Tax=Maricaulis sp. TaxID=1486257 RepID=UPI0025C5D8D5|nr:mitochondrial fission ELM1 family protein [Maricaulis sp.]
MSSPAVPKESVTLHTVIWVVSDGRRGIENQALGLAEAVAVGLDGDTVIERVTVRKDGFVTLPAHSHPDIWIGCGRAAIPLAQRHRRIFPECFFVYVQDPRTRHADFDLIIAPRHDRLSGANVLTMTGSPNRVTDDVLTAGAVEFERELAALPGKRAAVLIGGDSKRFRLDTASADYLESRLDSLLDRGLSLMITVSRRTPDNVRTRFRQHFSERPNAWYHDGDGANPYFAFLAAADWIFVTEESTNMLVEACTTGTPVYVLPLTGTPGKFARLHADLEAHGAVRPYLGQLDSWTYTPLHETQRVAHACLARYLQHRQHMTGQPVAAGRQAP